MQLDDKDWADEIRKDTYDDSLVSNQEEETNILDAESTHNEYMKLSDAFKSDLVEYFQHRQPAAYGKYAD